MGALLERTPHLAALREARATGGSLVLLSGEAGAGKTSLLRHFAAECDHVLWGACDPLFTPRPLGPFVDLAHAAGGELRALLDADPKPHQVAEALVRAAAPVVVLEDLHWADEATLDVVTLLARRIEAFPGLLVASYRDDELDRAHPLRRLLGEVRGRRLTASPLSRAAVAALAEPHGVDPEALHRTTGGNPFFVTEALAAGGDAIPATVRDAVLARAARLGTAATAVVEAVSVALPHAELWLLDALTGTDGLDEALASGMIETIPDGLAFRHELARLAVADAIPPHRARELHRRALRALADGPPDLARLAHHAEAAGDTEAVLAYAPAAAARAASTGAHREAAAQYARALRFGARLPAKERAALLERRSYECYITEQTDESIAALEGAIGLWEADGDTAAAAAGLSMLSRRLWCAARPVDATEAGMSAVRLLEGRPAGPELALAYSNLAQIHLNDERPQETVFWSRRALDLAEAIGDEAVIVHSLNNLGTIGILTGSADGWETLAASLDRALVGEGLEEHVGRAFIHAGWTMNRTRAYDRAEWLDRGIDLCERLGLDGWWLYVVAYRARFHLDAGRFAAAEADAVAVLRRARSIPLLRILALTVLGLARARRGDPAPYPELDEAVALLDGQYELQYHAPVATARAEVAWLTGSAYPSDVDGSALALAADRGAAWVVGELRWWARLGGAAGGSVAVSLATGPPAVGTPVAGSLAAGSLAAGPPVAGTPVGGPPAAGPPAVGTPVAGPTAVGTPVAGSLAAGPPVAGSPVGGPPVAGPPVGGPPAVGTPVAGAPVAGPPVAGAPGRTPFDLALAGDVRGAAAAWRRLGCPYDAAVALGGSDVEADLRRAFDDLQALGARPAAAIVARRLRGIGARAVPRGPRPTTAGHPAGLTSREVEVLTLVRSGATNADIAARLVLSEKTVHHHVSAILRKLGVSNRGQAATAASRLGLPA